MTNNINSENNIELALVGLGWKVKHPFTPPNFDVDVAVFMLGENGKLLRDEDLVFYNNKNGRDGAVVLSDDNRKGVNDTNGDCEHILIDFRKIPDEIKKLSICVSMFDGDIRNHSFGQVENAYIRIAKLVDEFDYDGEHLMKFNLEKEFPNSKSLIMAEVIRENGGWRFVAVANGSNRGGFDELCEFYGGEVEA